MKLTLTSKLVQPRNSNSQLNSCNHEQAIHVDFFLDLIVFCFVFFTATVDRLHGPIKMNGYVTVRISAKYLLFSQGLGPNKWSLPI